MVQSTATSNGQLGGKQGSRRLPPAPPALPAVSHPAQPEGRPPYAFCAADTDRIGFRQRLPIATLVVGIGSQGSAVAQAIAAMAQTEFGRLPGPFAYQMIDAAAPVLGMDGQHFLQIGVAGSGTKPSEGLQRFNHHYSHIRANISKRLQWLFQPDPEFPLGTLPREAINLVLVGGSGGTSGGSLHRAIDLLHDVAQDWDVQEPRVHVVLIGAEIALRDRSRQVSPEQQRVVRDTAANNLIKLCGDLADPGHLSAARPDGTTFSIPASRRVWLVSVADQSNGECQYSTNAAFNDMLAYALFAQVFTQGGIYLRDRFEDLDRLGVTQRAQL